MENNDFLAALDEAKKESEAFSSGEGFDIVDGDSAMLIPKKMSDFRGSELCVTKREHEDLMFNSQKDNRYDNAIAVKTIIHMMLHGEMEKNIGEANDMIDQIIEDNSPTMETDRLRRKELAENIMRYIRCETRKPLDGKFMGYVDKAEYRIRCKADEVFDDGSKLEGVLYRAGSPSVTQNGHKRDYSVEGSAELHLLLEYLKQLVPAGQTRKLVASYYFMKKSGDSKQRDPDFFKGTNVVSLVDTYTNNGKGSRTDIDVRLDNMIEEYAVGRECSGEDCEKCPFNCACNFVQSPERIEEKVVRKKEPVQYTDAQTAIINKKNGISRVIAGAGAGKTECVAERFKRLVMDIIESDGLTDDAPAESVADAPAEAAMG